MRGLKDTFSLPGPRDQKSARAARDKFPMELRSGVAINPPLLTFWDCVHAADNVKLTVLAQEVREVINALAIHNGFEPAELLANVEILPNKPLPCRIISQFPPEYSFMPDNSGYVVPKFRMCRSVIGHSFISDGSCTNDDPDFQPNSKSKRLKIGSPRDDCLLRRNRARACAPTSLKDAADAHGSAVGKRQSVPFRLHRAAALAASLTPDKDSRCWGILHICGRKNCGVAAHYRPGSRKDNEDDETYHIHSMGQSRKYYPPLQ